MIKIRLKFNKNVCFEEFKKIENKKVILGEAELYGT